MFDHSVWTYWIYEDGTTDSPGSGDGHASLSRSDVADMLPGEQRSDGLTVGYPTPLKCDENSGSTLGDGADDESGNATFNSTTSIDRAGDDAGDTLSLGDIAGDDPFDWTAIAILQDCAGAEHLLWDEAVRFKPTSLSKVALSSTDCLEGFVQSIDAVDLAVLRLAELTSATPLPLTESDYGEMISQAGTSILKFRATSR